MTVVQDNEHPSWFFLLGDGIDAPSHEPVTFLGGVLQQMDEGGELRTLANKLAFQGRYAAIDEQLSIGFVDEDERPLVLNALSSTTTTSYAGNMTG